MNRITVDAYAGGELDDVDVELVRRLAGLWQAADPAPDDLVERLQFGITLDALHAEIAELQRVDGLVGARGGDATDVQTITFTSSQLTTMITVSPISSGRVRVDGWAAPGAGLRVELRVESGNLQAVADDDGRFVFEDVPSGLGQFVLRPADPTATAVVTPSIDL
jgi:hypothetical protein